MKRQNRNTPRRTSRWRNGLLGLAAALFMAPAANAQVNYSNNFDANSTGWTGNFSRSTAAAQACQGAAAMRRNVYTATVGNLVSPTTGTAAGGVVTLTYGYRIYGYSSPYNPAPTPFGSFSVQYGATASGPWTTIATITDEAQTSSCINKTHTFTPPVGAVFIRWTTAWTAGDNWWSIDNVVVAEALPACAGMPNAGTITTPVTVCAGNTTTLTATGLTSNLSPGISYQWEESPDGIGSWGAVVGGSGATTASYTPTAITATRYFRLVTTCSSGPEVNNSNVVTVNSDPGSFAEDFSSGGANNNCWTNSGTGTPANLRYVTTSAYAVGTGSIMWDYYSQNGLTLIYTSPLITPIGSGVQLEFDVAAPQYNATSIDSIYIEQSNNGGASWTLVYAGSNAVGSGFNTLPASTTEYNTPASGDWQARAFGLAAGTNRVRFRGVSKFGNNIHIDNIALGAAPSCQAPTAVGASNLTGTSADIAWTCTSCTGTYIVEYGTTGFTPGTDGTPGAGGTIWTGSPVASSPVTITGLSPVTGYAVYVREVCAGPDYSPNSFATNFTTPCATYTPNYSEDFSTFVPNCWNRGTGPISGPTVFGSSGWIADGFGNVGSTGSARVEIYSTGGQEWLITPSFDLSAGGYELNFDVALTQWNATTSQTIELDDAVYLMQSTDDGTTWTTINTWNNGNSPSNTGDNTTINISAVNSANTRFAFFMSEGATSGGDKDFFVDNFQVRTPPACPDVTGLTANNLSLSNVDISWNAAAGATNYVWEIQDAPNAQGTPGAVASGSGVSTSASAAGTYVEGSNYILYVNSVCGGPAGNYQSLAFTLNIPPANDNCGTPTAMTVNTDYACGSVTAGTLTNATASADVISPCFGTPNNDVWFSFVATSTSHRVSLLNVAPYTDMYHAVYSGSCGALTNVNCNDGDVSNLTGLSVGVTYLVRVYSYYATPVTMTFDVCIGTPPPPPPAPANDECVAAVNLTVNADYACGSVTAGTIAGATASAGAVSPCFGTADDDVWYTFTATSTAHRVSLTNITGSTTDMYMAISSGSCGSLTSVLCSDPNEANLTGLTVGVVYTVRVYTYTSTPGQTSSFNICVGTAPPPPPAPANDECVAAVNLTVNADYACGSVTAGTIAGATASAGAVSPCFGTADDDVWYTFTATSTAHRVSLINITGSTSDMYMAISSGSCGSLTSVLCSDPETANLTGLTVGVVYTVRVYTYSSTPGQTSSFNICVGTPPPPPANDLCANAIAVGCNTITNATTVASTNTGAPTGCTDGLTSAGGIWYTLAGFNGTMTVDLSGSSFDTKVGIFTGSCGALTCVASDDDGGTGVTSLVTFTGSSAQTYYIYVTGYLTNTGAITMTVTCGDNNPACTANGLNLEFQNDANPGQVTWEVLNQSGSLVVLSGADPVPANSVGTQALCLPDGCYRLRVLDSAGDGMTTGGYQLRETGTNGRRIIDNSNNFSTGSVSAISGGGTFCLPIGDVDLIFSSCDKLDWVNYKYMVCHADAAVAAEWVPSGANSVQDANSGYEFWIFDPNGTYSFRKFHPHNQSQGFSPASANRACRFKINDGYNTVLNPWIPENVKMNVRVRGRVNGVNQSFGPACTMMLNTAAAACPLTSLQDDPSNVNDFSCGVSRTFGGTNSGANKIVANPPQFVPAAVSNQVRYQFRFRIPAEGICIVRPIQTSPTLYLNWSAASGPQLVASKTYEVEVRASKDQGATWCAGGATPACDPTPATWGKACNVTISSVVTVQGGSSNMSIAGNGALTMFPNPNNGDQLTISLTEVASDVHTMSVDIYDLTGKRITARTIAVQDGFVTTVLDLNNEISNGLYMVNITAGEKTYTQRLVIQK